MTRGRRVSKGFAISRPGESNLEIRLSFLYAPHQSISE